MAKAICSVETCTKVVYSRSLCQPHYRAADLPLWIVNPDTGCWAWTGTVSAHTGYGWIGRGEFRGNAFNWVYTTTVGPVPVGLELDHLCRNRLCVNPAHLEPVTRRENQRRGAGFSGENARKTHCIRGHEFTPENTYLRPDDGNRQCRACNKILRQRRTERDRAKQTAIGV